MRSHFLKIVILPPGMKGINEVNWLDGFGSSKDYRCYAMRCPADILFCARMLESLLHWNCVFFNEMNVNPETSELKGMVFLSEIDKSKNAFIYLLPNKYLVSQAEVFPVDIFSVVEQQAEYYLFSKKGKSMFRSKSVGYEYLVLMCADKGYDLQSVEDELVAENRLPTENLSDYIMQRRISKGHDTSSFLQRLFVALELESRKFYDERAGDFLGDVRKLSVSNYLFTPFAQMDTDVEDRFLLREDV